MVSWCWVGLDWGWVIMGLSFVLDISNIARVGISSAVGDNLGATIRKSNTVFTSSGIAIPVLILLEAGTRVVISDSIAVLVDSWLIIGWLLVSWSWVVWGRFVNNWGWVVDWSWVWDNNWSSLVDWGWVWDNNWSCMVHWSWFMIDRGVDWGMSRGMDSSALLFSSIWVVDILWGSMGLAGNNSSI